MDHAEKARALFLEGYNCAQAVMCAFDDLTGLDRETSARLACSFGGGMGRMREVCGTVSGALLVLGQLCGYSDPKDPQAKIDQYDHLPGTSERSKDKARKRAGSEDTGILRLQALPAPCRRSGRDRR